MAAGDQHLVVWVYRGSVDLMGILQATGKLGLGRSTGEGLGRQCGQEAQKVRVSILKGKKVITYISLCPSEILFPLPEKRH